MAPARSSRASVSVVLPVAKGRGFGGFEDRHGACLHGPLIANRHHGDPIRCAAGQADAT